MPGEVPALHRVIAAAGAITLATALGVVARRAPAPDAGSVVRASRPLMGTLVEVAIWAPAGGQPRAATEAAAALDAAAALEARISEWQRSSETSAVNHAAGGEAVRVSADMVELVNRSIDWTRRTGGAFDVTGGPLFELWETARAAKTAPPDAEVDRLRRLIGADKIEVERDRVRLGMPGMKLGFGAIGKGFVAERMAAFLRSRGVDLFVIDAGGDLVVSGAKGDRPWDVAIRHPRREGPLAYCRDRDYAVATSGDDGRYFESGGVRYSPIIDPRTGRPADRVASATVFARLAADAGALAAAASVLGVEEGVRLVEALPDADALLVGQDGAVKTTSGLRLAGDVVEWRP